MMIAWEMMIQEEMKVRPRAVAAHMFIRCAEEGVSKAVVLGCSDGGDYYVKGRHLGKPTCNEQIVGSLANSLGAPVPEVRIIQVPAELIESESNLAEFAAGPAHGSKAIPGASRRAWIEECEQPENRPRFAILAVLYGWAGANDHHLIYTSSEPRTPYSVDHGHFFAPMGKWTIESLSAASAATADVQLINGAKLLIAEIDVAIESLAATSDADIARAVASPPESWDIKFDERVKMAQYLHKRKEEILGSSSRLIK